MRELLQQGKSVAVFPGGAKESGYATPGLYKLYLEKRRGFLRLALETRSDVLACYTFGDEALWRQCVTGTGPEWLHAIMGQLREALGIMPPTWKQLVPNRVPLTTVVGVPLDMSDLFPVNGESASEANIDEASRRYSDMLTKLFNSNKALVPGGHSTAELVIA